MKAPKAQETMQIIHIKANRKETSLLSKTNANIKAVISNTKTIEGAIMGNESLATQKKAEKVKIIIDGRIFQSS